MNNEERALLGLPLLYRVTNCCKPGFKENETRHICSFMTGRIVRVIRPRSINRLPPPEYGSIYVSCEDGQESLVWSVEPYEGDVERL